MEIIVGERIKVSSVDLCRRHQLTRTRQDKEEPSSEPLNNNGDSNGPTRVKRKILKNNGYHCRDTDPNLPSLGVGKGKPFGELISRREQASTSTSIKNSNQALSVSTIYSHFYVYLFFSENKQSHIFVFHFHLLWLLVIICTI